MPADSHSDDKHTNTARRVPSVALGIETSNPRGSQGAAEVALRRADAEDEVEPVRTGASGSDDLLPAIDRLTRRVGVSPGDLDRVTVSIGPGGYTACRVAVTAAMMIAETIGCDLVGVPTPIAVLRALPGGVREREPIMLLAWKRETVWRFDARAHGGSPLSFGALAPLGSAVDHERPLVCDADLRDALAEQRLISDSCDWSPIRFSASATLDAAERMPTVDPGEIAPIYPREPEAVTKWRARGA